MGNSSSQQDRWEEELKNWDFLEETVDPLFGMIKIYQRKNSKSKVCVINKITNQNLQTKTELKLNHPNILKLYSMSQTKQQNYCSSFSKIVMIFEYAQNDLRRHILQRKLQSKGFTEPQILKLIHSTASALKYLQEFNLHHLDLQPSNILLDQNGEIKLLDLSVMNVQINGYTQALLGLREVLHLSPEEVKALNQKKTIEDLDKEKCDVFQLALSVLMAIQLDVGLTLYAKNEFENQKLQEILKDVSQKYSSKLGLLLKQMSEYDSMNRITFKEILNSIEQILPQGQLPENITCLESFQQIELMKQDSTHLKSNSDYFTSDSNNIWFASRTKQDDTESLVSQQSQEHIYSRQASKLKEDIQNIKIEQNYTYNPNSNQMQLHTLPQPDSQRINSREENEIKRTYDEKPPLPEYQQDRLNRASSFQKVVQNTVPLNPMENKTQITSAEQYWEQYKNQLYREREQFDSLRRKSPIAFNFSKQNSENIQDPSFQHRTQDSSQQYRTQDPSTQYKIQDPQNKIQDPPPQYRIQDQTYQRNLTPSQKLIQQTSQPRFQSNFITSPEHQNFLSNQKPSRFQSNNDIGFSSPQFQRTYQPQFYKETEIFKQRENSSKERLLSANTQASLKPPLLPPQSIPKPQIRNFTPTNTLKNNSNQNSISSIDQRIQEVLQRSQQALKLYDKTSQYDQYKSPKSDPYQITEKRSVSPVPTQDFKSLVKPTQKYNEEYIQSILKQAQLEIARSKMNSGNYY